MRKKGTKVALHMAAFRRISHILPISCLFNKSIYYKGKVGYLIHRTNHNVMLPHVKYGLEVTLFFLPILAKLSTQQVFIMIFS